MTASNHFNMKLLSTYAGLIEAADVSIEKFFNGWRFIQIYADKPTNFIGNFVAVCERIAELRLPKDRATISIYSFLTISDGSVCFLACATSSLSGREYLARLASDAPEALRFLDLFTDTARSMGFPISGD